MAPGTEKPRRSPALAGCLAYSRARQKMHPRDGLPRGRTVPAWVVATTGGVAAPLLFCRAELRPLEAGRPTDGIRREMAARQDELGESGESGERPGKRSGGARFDPGSEGGCGPDDSAASRPARLHARTGEADDTRAGPPGTGIEDVVVSAASKLLGGVAAGRDVRKLVRYTATSVVSLGVSELALIVVDAETSLGATLSVLIANLAGAIPSYLLSRYWIWPEADRRRPARQAFLYWVTSILSWAISTVATGAIADADHAHHLLKLVLLGTVFILVNLALWVAKYVAYQTVIFRAAPSERELD